MPVLLSSRQSLQKTYEGLTWRDQVLGSWKVFGQVYISLDIDGLSPDLCPHTGTPVPGGLGFQQVDYLLYLLASSGAGS